MRLHNLPTAASIVLVLAGCQQTTPDRQRGPQRPETTTLEVRTSTGEPAAWAVVDLRDPRTQHGLGFFGGDARGEVRLGVAAGIYNLEVTSPKGYAKLSSRHLGHATPIELDTDCEQTTGRAQGDIHHGDFVWARNIVANEYYGAIVRPDRSFTLCTPPGSYAMEAHDDEMAPWFAFESGSRIDFEAYDPQVIDALPPPLERLPFVDSLESLISSDVRVIGIGEANHGTREFLALRTRESLHLARTSGVRFIALEAGSAEVFPLDDYVHGRVKDVSTHVAKLGFWMWDTEEMLASLSEIRQYNRSVAEEARVSLVGIDVQHSSGAASYLLGSGISLSEEQRRVLEHAKTLKSLKDLDRATAVSYLDTVATLRERGPLPFRTAMALDQLLWRLRMFGVERRVPAAERERGMAALVEALLAHAGRKRIVIWAHNTHVAADPRSEHAPLGSRLRARIGQAYLAVGISMGRGTFRAWDFALKEGVVPHTVDGPPPASLEAVLARFITKDYGFVRLRDVPELRPWLTIPRKVLDNGGVMPRKDDWLVRRLLDSFDVVGFVAEVTPTTPTATGVRRAEDRPK